MTIHRTYGDIEFECDGCGDGLETGTDSWTDAKAQLDEAGWSARKVDDAWLHFCCYTCLTEEFD